MIITGKQCLDARKLLGWSQSKLASEAAVSQTVVQTIEHEVCWEPRSVVGNGNPKNSTVEPDL